MIQLFHALNNSGNSLFALGSVELYLDFTKPTSTTDAVGVNTVDTSGGYTSFTRAYDFSGKGRHLGVPSKADAPKYDAGGFAKFENGQYFNLLDLPTTTTGTVIIVVENLVPNINTTNIIGAFNNSAIPGGSNAFAAFGNVAAAYANETFSYYTTGIRYIVDSVPAGFNTFAMSNGIVMNGVRLRSDADGSSTIRLLLGKRDGSSQFFTGNVKKLIMYSNYLTTPQIQRATTILNQ